MTDLEETPGFLVPGKASFWRRLLKPICLATLFLVMPFFRGKAQHAIDYAVHANIIYRFTKYIDWPEEKKSGDFVLGVVGDTPLFDELKKIISSKSVGNQKIVVKRFSTAQTDYTSHILFIPQEESSRLKKIVSKTAEMPVLLVTEEEGMSSQGACINFVIVGQRLKLEINKKNIERRNMHIASELLSLGKIVK